ncbi:hypothetical protein [Acinetobacter calcoaceticus]|uniref:Uncharacterized protein n=1 Tax=Acinetobacter calcoaceticus TaxID=471 RepID=A0ABD5ALA0_ACICA|nr:hypothetical protein [Acinetobacter calcoaceticus]MDP9803244.1 hypothetical protein [Acinetobacter calcoaceticus]
MNMKLHLAISLLILGLVSSQAYPKSKLEFLTEANELFNARVEAINRFQTLGILSEERQLNFKEQLELTNSVCNLANVNEQIKKFYNDNFEQSQELAKEKTTREQMNLEFEKENQSYLDIAKQLTGTPYECGKQNYKKLL